MKNWSLFNKLELIKQVLEFRPKLITNWIKINQQATLEPLNKGVVDKNI